MINVPQRSVVNDELVVAALSLLRDSISRYGVDVLNSRLQLARFAGAQEAMLALDSLVEDISKDEKFVFDNSIPLRIAIHMEGGLVQDVLPSKQIPMQVVVYDYEVDESDEDDSVSVFCENGESKRVTVAHHTPTYIHSIDINALFGDACRSLSGEVEDLEIKIAVEETYRVVVLSTAHLTESDRDTIVLGDHKNNHMVLKRETGFFIKLYDEVEVNYCEFMSQSLKGIIYWARENGFSMVEFDCDGPLLPHFETFRW